MGKLVKHGLFLETPIAASRPKSESIHPTFGFKPSSNTSSPTHTKRYLHSFSFRQLHILK